jgi:hypothetical protein
MMHSAGILEFINQPVSQADARACVRVCVCARVRMHVCLCDNHTYKIFIKYNLGLISNLMH